MVFRKIAKQFVTIAHFFMKTAKTFRHVAQSFAHPPPAPPQATLLPSFRQKLKIDTLTYQFMKFEHKFMHLAHF